MSLAVIIVSIFNILSVGFLGTCLLRIGIYQKKYRLRENRHSLLFGFISLQHVLLAYIAGVALQILLSYVLLYYLAMR